MLTYFIRQYYLVIVGLPFENLKGLWVKDTRIYKKYPSKIFFIVFKSIFEDSFLVI